MKLKDADVIEKFLDDFADCCGNHQKAVLHQVKYALGQMPAIDSEPVRHGHWVESCEDGTLFCSECGKPTYDRHDEFKDLWGQR